MPVLQTGSSTVRHRIRYQLQVANAINLALVDLSGVDTIVIDDTGAGGVATTLTLPKIGTDRAPIGHRLTLRKASTAALGVTITPTAPDVISSTAGAYPSVGATNVLALPTAFENTVTFEAMALNVTTGVPDATVSPTVGGIWMCVASSVVAI